MEKVIFQKGISRRTTISYKMGDKQSPYWKAGAYICSTDIIKV
ncbi:MULTISPECIES: hypothetical protein [Peribacillus]|nr:MULTISPECIES: hypothetical protein [Peribacillus]